MAKARVKPKARRVTVSQLGRTVGVPGDAG